MTLIKQVLLAGMSTGIMLATYGNSMKDPPLMAQKWFSDPSVKLHTVGSIPRTWPTIEATYGEMKRLANLCNRLEMRTVGQTIKGMPIKALIYKTSRRDAMTAMFQARVHGDEPASTEGLMELAYQIASGELSEIDINVIMIPVLNPEGAKAISRTTGTGIDPNRDYILHNSGVIKTVYRVIGEFDPEIVVDMHEYGTWKSFGEPDEPGSYTSAFDLKSTGSNNPNLSPGQRDLTFSEFIRAIDDVITTNGMRFGVYHLADRVDGKIRVRESATTFVSAKNALALGGRISLLLESRGIGIGNQHYTRRTAVHYLAARRILESAIAMEEKVKKSVSSAREAYKNKEYWILRREPKKYPFEFPLLSPETNSIKMLRGEFWDRTNGTNVTVIPVPSAYIIPAAQAAIINRLKGFGVKMKTLDQDKKITVEVIKIQQIEPGKDILYGEVLRNHDIKVSSTSAVKTIPKGSQIIMTNQQMSLYLMTLEPECLSGFAALSVFGSDLRPGYEFPIYRIRDQKQLDIF